jgi:hypothetical protein
MSDVKVIRYLLSHNTALNAVVPATRIMAGVLPQGIAAPAIVVTHISTVRKNFVAEYAVDYCTARTQVMVMAADYPTLKSTLALVRGSLPRSRGSVSGVAVEAVIADFEGPDFPDDAGLWYSTHDFQVIFNE